MLARSASPEAVLAVQATERETERFAQLARESKSRTLAFEEAMELHHYLLAERYVRLAKAHAYAKKHNLQI